MASYNTSLINTSNTGLLTPQQANEKSKGLLTNTRNEAYTKGIRSSIYKEPTYNKEALSEYQDYAMSRRFSQDFTTALSKQAQKYNEIAEYYKNFYVNGIAYDKNGNPIAGADATSYADKYKFAEFLHELYPELSVEYFMKNAESFMYRATGVKTDIKNYGDHLGNIWNASWKNAGDSIWTAMKYLGGALSGGFGSVEWENTKKELAKRRSLDGSNYRKDLGDERYNNIFAKMLSGSIEQSPQMAMMLASMAVSIATGGLSGAGGIVGKLALNSMARAKAAGNTVRVAMNAFNFMFSGLMDAGNFMAELSEAGVSDEAATMAGIAILGTTGFLETWGDNTLLAPVDKVANFLFKQKDSQIINTAAKSAARIIKEKGLSILGDIAASEITETVQEEAEYLCEVFAKELVVAYEAKYGNTLDREELGLTKEQIIESMKETARQTLLSTPLMTLGSNVIATGLDVAFGDLSNQWKPNKYMNKEGATNIRGTKNFVSFGPDIIDTNKKDADNGKANPIKAHTVGGYTFIDEKLSPKQYEILTSGNMPVYTVEANTKVTEKTATSLEAEAIKTGVFMKADTIDSYLANIEANGNLESYGYETKGKISAQNDGNATSLYITLKDSGETIKIDIGETNSSDEKLKSLKDFTNVEFKTLERAERVNATEDEFTKAKKRSEDREKKEQERREKKKEEARKKEEQRKADQNVDEGVVVETSEDGDISSEVEDDFDPFEGTAKEGKPANVKSALDEVRYNNDEGVRASSFKDFENEYKPAKSKGKHTEASQPKKTADSHVYLDENGKQEKKDIHNATVLELHLEDGSIERYNISQLGDKKIKDMLSYTKDNGSNPLDTQTKTFKKQNEKKNASYETAGVIPNPSEPIQKNVPQSESQVTEQDANDTSKAEVSANDNTVAEEVTATDTGSATDDTSSKTTQQKTEEQKDTEKPQITPVTAKEIDSLAESIEKDQKLSKDKARNIALLAKGVKDIFEFLGKKMSYEEAGKVVNTSILATADNLNKLIDNFIDVILDHPYGKDLFKTATNNKSFTKKAKENFKQEVISYLKGNQTNLSDTAINTIDQLFGPLNGAIKILDSLTAEDKAIAEKISQTSESENQKSEETSEVKTEAEKELDKKKHRFTVDAQNTATLAGIYADTNARRLEDIATKQPEKASHYTAQADAWRKLAERYKNYAKDISGRGYDAAMEFASSFDARQAEKWADYEVAYETKNKKTGEKETKRGKIGKRLVSTEERVNAIALYAIDYYNQISDRQIRTIDEMRYMPITSYQLSKLNLALNENLYSEIDRLVGEICAGLPSVKKVVIGDNYERDSDGNIVYEDFNGRQVEKEVENPRSEKELKAEFEKNKADAELENIFDIYDYLGAIISLGGDKIGEKIQDEITNLNISGAVVSDDKRGAKVKTDEKTVADAIKVVDDIKPVIAYAMAEKFVSQFGDAKVAAEKYIAGKLTIKDLNKFFNDYAIDSSSLISVFDKDSLLYQSYKDFKNNLAALQNTDEEISYQFVGERGLKRLSESNPYLTALLDEAKNLNANGVSMREIFEMTGFWKGTDGLWRSEVADLHDIEVNTTANWLGSYISDELSTAYPFLNTIKIVYVNSPLSDVGGAYSAENRTITVNMAYADDAVRTILHETQHAIQEFEGHAWGSSPQSLQSQVASDSPLKHEVDSALKTYQENVAYKQIELALRKTEDNALIYAHIKKKLDEAVASGNEANHKLEKIVEERGEQAVSSIIEDFINKAAIKMEFKHVSKEAYQNSSAYRLLTESNLLDKKISDVDVEGLTQLISQLQKEADALDLDSAYKSLEKFFGYQWEYGPDLDREKNRVGRIADVYWDLAGEVEARNVAKRYTDNSYDKFPLDTQDRHSYKQKLYMPDGKYYNVTDESVLVYERNPLSTELSATPIERTNGRPIDYFSYNSSFEYDKNIGMYYINAENVYNEIQTVLTATYPEGEEVDVPDVKMKAKLASIFLTSLSDEAQDAIVRQSTDKNRNNGKILGGNEVLLRLFFTPDELNEVNLNARAKGASFANWGKIFLTNLSDESTVVHETGHILWRLDESFRKRAVSEYTDYFKKDANGDSIRVVVEANPDSFGGYSADEIINALKRLTSPDYDYTNKSNLVSEEAIQYMFQNWWEGRDTLEYAKGIRGLFERMAAYIKKVAERIQKFFGVDILNETNNKVFSPLFSNVDEAKKFYSEMKTQDVDFSQFDRPKARSIAISGDGTTRLFKADNALMITHGISFRNFEKVLGRGGRMSVPSLALANPLYIPSYGQGGITFIGTEEMARTFINEGYVLTSGATGSHPRTKKHKSEISAFNVVASINSFFTLTIDAITYGQDELMAAEENLSALPPQLREIAEYFYSSPSADSQTLYEHALVDEQAFFEHASKTIEKIVAYMNNGDAKEEIDAIASKFNLRKKWNLTFDRLFSENVLSLRNRLSRTVRYLLEDGSDYRIARGNDGRLLEDTVEDVTEFLIRRIKNKNYNHVTSLEKARFPRENYNRIYLEAKPLLTMSFHDFNVAIVETDDIALFDKIKTQLAPFGLAVLRYSNDFKYEEHYNEVVSSVKGVADHLLFQTVGSAITELTADSQPRQKKQKLIESYEELVYRHVKSDLTHDGDVASVYKAWKKSVRDFAATSTELASLQTQLENTGIFHNVDIQNNLSSSMKATIKSDVTKRLAYEREDYVRWTNEIKRIRDNLRDADGTLRKADSAQVKEALYTLYGYREVKNKSPEGKTTTKLEAVGLLSRVFALDKKSGSKWGSIVEELASTIKDRAVSMSKSHENEEQYRYLQFLSLNELEDFFLNKSIWGASKTATNNNVLKGDSKEYSTLAFTLPNTSTTQVFVGDIEAFLTTLVDFDGNPFIVQRREANFGDEGKMAMSLTGPLVDIVNYAHLDETAVKSGLGKDSILNVDQAFAWAAYNNYKNSSLNKGRNTLDESIYLLDKTTYDYIDALEKLKNNTLLKGIYEKGISQEVLASIEESIKGLKEEAQKKLETVQVYKLDLAKASYDDLTRTIQKGLNSLNVVAQIVRPKVGQSGLTEAQVNKLKSRISELEAFVKESEKAVKSDSAVNESDELKRVRKELFESNEELKKAQEALKKAREELKGSTGNAIKSISALLKDPSAATDERIKKFLEDYQALEKKAQGYRLALRNANIKAYEAEKALQRDTVLADSTLKELNKYGLGALFSNTKKALKEVATKSSRGEAGKKLQTLIDAIYSRPKKGNMKTIKLREALDFRGVYSTDVSEKATTYFDNAEKLRKFVAANMIEKSDKPNIGIVVKTLDNLTAGQLVTLENLITRVAKDSVAYNIELFKTEKDYNQKWYDSIIDEIHTYAESKGVDFSELTTEDRTGIDSSKKTDFFKDLIEQFTLQSKKYRYTYPTLYNFLFGGDLDHAGNSSGWGLNEAQNKFYAGEDYKVGKDTFHREGYSERAEKLQKLIIDNLSGSMFYKGKITEKNFYNVFNIVKRSWRTTLSESTFTDEDIKNTGMKIEEYTQGNKTVHVVSVNEEYDSPAMREIALYIGNQQAQLLDINSAIEQKTEKLQELEKKLDDTNVTFDKAVSTISRLQKEIDALKTLDTSSFNEEELRDHNDRVKKMGEILDETISAREELKKSVNSAQERVESAKEDIEKKKRAFDILAQKGGTEKNENKYTTQEILGIYLTVRQEGGINRLVFNPTLYDAKDSSTLMSSSSKTNNLSLENIIWVVKQIEENPDYAPLKKVADGIVDIMSSSFDAVKDTKFYLSDGQVMLEKIPFYFTFTIQPDEGLYDLPEVNLEMAEAKADNKISADAKVSQGMTEQRNINTNAPLNLAALDTAFNQLYKQEYYVAFGKELKNLVDLTKDKRFRPMLIAAEGRSEASRMYDSLSKFINALGNGNKTPRASKLNDIIHFWTNNTAAGALAYSLPNVLMQFPTILVCLDDKNIGLKGIVSAMGKAIKDDEVMRLSPQIREMVSGYVDNIRKSNNMGSLIYNWGVNKNSDRLQQLGLNIERGIKGWQNFGLKGLDWANIYAAKAMWYAYFDGVQKEKADLRSSLTKEEFEILCANEATQRVMDITPIQQKKDNSELYNNSDSWVRNALLFTAQTGKMMNRYISTWNQGQHEEWSAGKMAKSIGKLLAVSVFIWLANSIIKGKFSGYFDDDDDDEQPIITALSNALDFTMSGLESEIVGLDKLSSSDYGGILQDFNSLIKVATKDPDERTEHQMANAIAYSFSEVLGLFGGMNNAVDRGYRTIRDIPEYGFAAFSQLYNNRVAKRLESLTGDN